LERKLTAILCADVFGYSRLMGEDEEATLRTLSSHRKLIDSLIEQHHGRFVNSAGDSVLAEFASVVNAVQCAVEVQTTLKAENANIPPNRRMEFRIGVNLGDVMVDGEQIYGDGVNVAARLESLADPGGICISGKVHDEIRSKLALGYDDLGEQRVKNIAEPVRVFRVLSEAGTATTSKKNQRVARKYMRRGIFSMVGLAIIAAVIVFVQHLSLRPPSTTASIPPAQSPALTLPGKPSIAVLPFTNMSGDREQEYFSDGITDDLISALSRLPGLFVIARTSSFTYKGKAVGLQDVGKELGVKYVLGGGVRRAGDQVRITVQLADATTGEELWAERYDRPLRDIFALQDEIVRTIVTTLDLQLTLAQRGILIPRTTDNLEAYDDLLRGEEYFNSSTKNGLVKARQMLEKAIQLDPKYALAYSFLGLTYWAGWAALYDPDGLEQGLHVEQQALALDDSLSLTHISLAEIYVFKGQYDQAVSEAERGVSLNPNAALGYFVLASVMNNMAKPAEALAAAERAMRLDPDYRDKYGLQEGIADTQLGRYQASVAVLKRYVLAVPNNIWGHLDLVDDYVELGRGDDARAELTEALRINPQLSLAALAAYRPKQRLSAPALAERERFEANLRKAGLK
jgi:adenylate cyclase